MMEHRGGRQDELIFADRPEAGQLLGERLARHRGKGAVVLGVTRGGVPVAFEVASALHADLDVIVVKKIGAPSNRELALGAVCSDGTAYVRHDAAHEFSIGPGRLDEEIEMRAVEALTAEVDYRGDDPAIDLGGRRVIIVDDGVATGSTLEAAVMSARKREAAHITVAVPIASVEAARRLSASADEFIALETPAAFWAVGQFYRDFSQVTDESVRQLLRQNRAAVAGKEGSR